MTTKRLLAALSILVFLGLSVAAVMVSCMLPGDEPPRPTSRPAVRSLLKGMNEPWITLFESMWYMETGGTTGPRGPFCIWRDFWADGCEFGGLYGTKWDYENAVLDYDRCTYVIYLWWCRYVPEAVRTHNFEILVRTFRGGPRGHKEEWTRQYWDHVRNLMFDPGRKQYGR